MTSILIDIGRHKFRFGVMNGDEVITRVHHEATDDAIRHHSSFTEFISQTIQRELGVALEKGTVIAVAAPGPFAGDTFDPMFMPGGADWLDWSIGNLRERLSRKTYVVHDMVACALSVAQLRHDDVVPLLAKGTTENRGSGDGAQPNPSTLYIQAAVGVGVSALIPLPNGSYLPFSSEGASDTLAPHPDDDDEQRVYEGLLSRDRSERRWGFMSALHILSAETLPSIHEILHRERPTPEAITDGAVASDSAALRTLRVYAGFLGTFAGNMALSLRAYNGVYIGGSIPAALSELLTTEGQNSAFAEIQSHFRKRFAEREKGNWQLLDVPVSIVRNENNALLGLREIVRSVNRKEA